MDLMSISSILGDAGQFMLGLATFSLSIYALSTKGRDIFRSELAKSQFVEVGLIRSKLSQIFYDVHYVSQAKVQIETMGWTLEDFRLKCPEEWGQYCRYRSNSLDLFYKLSTTNYYLLPVWIHREKIVSHVDVMKRFAPFTIHSTGKASEQVRLYQDSTLALLDHLDVELRKHA